MILPHARVFENDLSCLKEVASLLLFPRDKEQYLEEFFSFERLFVWEV